MSESKFGPEAFSQGDIMRRLRKLEGEVTQLRTARALQAAFIGAEGLRIRGGKLTIQDIQGEDMFRAGGDPGELFLRQNLLTPLAIAILADRVVADSASGQVTAVDTGGYQDLGGPEVEIDIGPSGIALVFISSLISGADTSSAAGSHASVGGRMSFEVSGATNQLGSNDRSVAYTNSVAVGGQVTQLTCAFRQGTSVVVSGLNEGTNIFRAMYARLFVGKTMNFADRTIIVLGF